MVNYKQRAYDFIRDQIFEGAISSGARVSDYAVAKLVGVSRTPVREAMSQLATEGFLEQVPKHGYFVKKLSRKELAELFDIRLLLEGYSVEKATDAITEKRLAELDTLCAVMKEIIEKIRAQENVTANDPIMREQILNDVAFHLSIIRAAESPRILRMVSDLRLLTQLFSYKRLNSWLADPVTPLLETWREHRSIVDAIRDRDPKLAKERMEAHLDLGKQRALEFYDRSQVEEGGDRSGIPLQVTELIRQMEEEDGDEE